MDTEKPEETRTKTPDHSHGLQSGGLRKSMLWTGPKSQMMTGEKHFYEADPSWKHRAQLKLGCPFVKPSPVTLIVLGRFPEHIRILMRFLQFRVEYKPFLYA